MPVRLGIFHQDNGPPSFDSKNCSTLKPDVRKWDAQRDSIVPFASMPYSRKRVSARSSTLTLKQWLFEHYRNPYPTKNEKLMLSMLTNMTMTQVSTWFANARRRLKKESKPLQSSDSNEKYNATQSNSSSDNFSERQTDYDEGCAHERQYSQIWSIDSILS